MSFSCCPGPASSQDAGLSAGVPSGHQGLATVLVHLQIDVNAEGFRP